ncbi:hypothetical protein MAL08_03845 [Leptospira noguchii]|uniref:hypothetical protein n=1 Tax=Leptospira noguchii TaxID=28182 RepID=UPI001FB63AAD|nr:hypothetical protein [Leptospira noguchii]UOG39608.1 hypothetical protein MAL08_03845 [Leptospira noguchii]
MSFKRDPRNSANASLRIGIQESVLLSSILILRSYSTCGVGYDREFVALSLLFAPIFLRRTHVL